MIDRLLRIFGVLLLCLALGCAGSVGYRTTAALAATPAPLDPDVVADAIATPAETFVGLSLAIGNSKAPGVHGGAVTDGGETTILGSLCTVANSALAWFGRPFPCPVPVSDSKEEAK